MIRILLVGPLPPPMGGNTRHFITLLEDLRRDSRFSVRLINTSRAQGFANLSLNLRAAVRTFFGVIASLRRVDIVSYHASARGMFLFGPLIVGLCRMGNKPVVLRIFGGGFGDLYERQGSIGRLVIRKCILSADIVLLQTKRAIRQLEGHASGSLDWFSTYIKLTSRRTGEAVTENDRDGSICSRFVFLGHLWRTKGIETLLEAAPDLPGSASIDVYGPPDEYTEQDFARRGSGRVRYRGFLTHAEVERKLWDYDCLVLPTFHPGEGYPGVIAEAFAHALPVITTNWLAIPEIVDSSCGILIEPGDTKAFVAALSALHHDPHRWQELRRGAAARAAAFDHEIWSRKFEDLCLALVRG